ncbi:MAG: molybdopterin-dependent oxidoreductase [Sulfurifustaceae bacterium]
MPSRRDFLKTTVGTAALFGAELSLPRIAGAADQNGQVFGPSILPAGTLDTASLETLPGKRPLIKRAYRPPNFETPITYFQQAFTPNDVFFVRYHLSNIPEVNAQAWRLRIGGDSVQRPFELTFDALRTEFEAVQLNAVCMCSGNRRGLFVPHVTGVEWGYGAMGHAAWRGARLKDVLARAGLRADALEVVLNGSDSGVIDKTPDFVKSLPIWKALDENTIVAYEMNGQALPHWNGFPVRLVVPGWTATYWVKHLTSIDIANKPFDGFWMKSAYRIPLGKFPVVDRFTSQETAMNTPITEMVVNSLIVSPADGAKVPYKRTVTIRGVAWDGGYGIRRVEVSSDGGETWRPTALGNDYGRFGWRQWTYDFQATKRGNYTLQAKATNTIGQTQTFELIQNPAGYHHNLVSRINVTVA